MITKFTLPKTQSKSNVPLFWGESPIKVLKVWTDKRGETMAWVELLNSKKRVDVAFKYLG